jgi:hypothetical protein
MNRIKPLGGHSYQYSPDGSRAGEFPLTLRTPDGLWAILERQGF